MTTRPRSVQSHWVPYAGLLMSATSVVYTAGALTQRVDQLEIKVAKLEASDAVKSERGARIEAKVDFLVDEQRKGERP